MIRILLAIPLALAAVLGFPPGPADRAHAGVQDFEFESFESDYYLGVDAEGRSTLRTVERLVAVFPDHDQNRGIQRAIPADYDGHPTDVEIVSVTDENGAPRDFEIESEDGDDDEDFVLLTIAVPEGEYVHGEQTYVIEYTQRNVTLHLDDHIEFYWDANGTGWAQPFGHVTARTHVPDELAAGLIGQQACYVGRSGAGEQCEITVSAGEGETVFEARADDLGMFETLTFAIGFEPGTFVPRDSSYLASPFAPVQLVSAAVLLLALLWAFILRFTALRDGPGRTFVIAEYAPPEGMSPFMAAVLLKRRQRAVAAQFLDFAVKRNIRIVESPAAGKNTYTLELVDPAGVEGPELELLKAIFGRRLEPGSSHKLKTHDRVRAKRIVKLINAQRELVLARGLRRKPPAAQVVPPLLLAIVGAVGTAIGGFLLLDDARGGFLPVLLWMLIPIGLIVAFAFLTRRPYTAEGAELRDHLEGLKLYISLAEADRLRMLQSPEGAERVRVDPNDRGEVLKLYEKLLPYSVVFKLEKRWASEIGPYYGDQEPDWYHGQGVFHVALFSAGIGALSSTVSTTYSGSSSSSSSGGSGGGGSSGGGGGGGGGGGV